MATISKDGGPASLLSRSWYNLRLSVRCPDRVPTWDAVLVTAASPEQAMLYQWHLDRAKSRGTIATSTIAMAVPDPHGIRIGSGGATLHALRSLALFLQQEAAPAITSQDQAINLVRILGMSVLLIHAGGDSKRVPWANPIGKAFLPLPFLADNDPNEPAPSLFDHILALSSYVAQKFKHQGGLFIMTGDVLPIYDFSHFSAPDDGACIVTLPAPINIAANHGVVLPARGDQGAPTAKAYYERVEGLLQKPTREELLDSSALLEDGRALLDSGIFAVRGRAWRNLLELSTGKSDPVLELLHQREEVSLYEEIAGAWVPSCHEWLKRRPLGIKLLEALSSDCIFSFCAQGLSFLHFGTSVEVLAHLTGFDGGVAQRRQMALTMCSHIHKVAASAVILSSRIHDYVVVGEQSLVFNCTLANATHVGSRCIMAGICLEVPSVSSLIVPDEHSLWEVPVVDGGLRVTLCCSIHDNPKVALSKMGTFCGKPWKSFLHDLGIEEADVWSTNIVDVEQKSLWNAKLFPVMAPGKGIVFAMWLMGTHHGNFLSDWRQCRRVSLSELHGCIDFPKLCREVNSHQANISAGLAEASLRSGSLQGNFSKLCTQIVQGHEAGIEGCNGLLKLCSELPMDAFNVPMSRVYQARVDLCNAVEDVASASACEKQVWDAVARETAIAVRQDEVTKALYQQPRGLLPVNKANVSLPARVDFAGGWSDTPPWSLERAGTVLNMAILLEGLAPIGVGIEVHNEVGISICDDGGHCISIKDPSTVCPPFDLNDPFRLVKAALFVTGLSNSSSLRCSGLTIKTWANVPRGSGLGTSSILAAAVVKAILRIIGADGTNENVAHLVLVMEQLMGTGGGWQDQIGGLYPGIKCTTGCPSHCLLLEVQPLLIAPALKRELEERLVIFFTGQVRLAHNVLQNVVRRYLQRDAILISSIEQLIYFARMSQEALAMGDLNELGRIMLDVWLLHQELDPFCSNASVDLIFRKVHPHASGYKLMGAGGGGFGLLMAKDEEAAVSVKEVLKGMSVQVYEWKLHENE